MSYDPKEDAIKRTMLRYPGDSFEYYCLFIRLYEYREVRGDYRNGLSTW